jgi:hypothetical protein
MSAFAGGFKPMKIMPFRSQLAAAWNSRSWRCACGLLVLPGIVGCAPRGSATQPVPQPHAVELSPPSRVNVEKKPVLLGYNFLAGATWTWEVTQGGELETLLRKQMPSPGEVDANASPTQVLEAATHRTVIWIPPLSDEDRSKMTIPYSHEFNGRPVPTVGEYLRRQLTILSEFGPHLPPINGPDDEEWCNVIFITRQHILVIAVPSG